MGPRLRWASERSRPATAAAASTAVMVAASAPAAAARVGDGTNADDDAARGIIGDHERGREAGDVRAGGGAIVWCGGSGAVNAPVAVPPAAGHQMGSRPTEGRKGARGRRRGVAPLLPPCAAANVFMAAGPGGDGKRVGGANAGRKWRCAGGRMKIRRPLV